MLEDNDGITLLLPIQYPRENRMDSTEIPPLSREMHDSSELSEKKKVTKAFLCEFLHFCERILYVLKYAVKHNVTRTADRFRVSRA